MQPMVSNANREVVKSKFGQHEHLIDIHWKDELTFEFPAIGLTQRITNQLAEYAVGKEGSSLQTFNWNRAWDDLFSTFTMEQQRITLSESH